MFMMTWNGASLINGFRSLAYPKTDLRKRVHNPWLKPRSPRMSMVVGALAIFLPFSPAFAWYTASEYRIFDDHTYTVDVDHLLSLMDSLYAGGYSPSVNEQNIPGTLHVNILGEKTTNTRNGCYLPPGTVHIPLVSLAELRANNYAIIRSALETLRGRRLPGGAKCTLEDQGPNLSYVWLQVVAKDLQKPTANGYYDGLHIGLTVKQPFPPATGHCTASLPPIALGTLKPSTPFITGSSNLAISCTAGTIVNIVVNNNKPYKDPYTSVTITQVGRTEPTLCLSCTLPITMRLDDGPTNPGLYDWALPVVVNYE